MVEASNLQWMFLTRGGQVSLNHSRHGLPERILYNQQYKLNHLTHITFFTLSVNFNLKCHANVINIKKILNWNMPFVSTSVTVGCTPEHSHSLVGCLKRAIDSSKQNQIKTSHLQTTKKKKKKKKLLHKAMSRGFPHESRSCLKSCRKYWQSLWRKK